MRKNDMSGVERQGRVTDQIVKRDWNVRCRGDGVQEATLHMMVLLWTYREPV